MELENPQIGTSRQLGALVGVSASLAQDLVNFCSIGPISEYIGIGLSIFMVSYPTTGAIATLRESVALYDQQVDSIQSVTVKEADEIRKRQKFAYPSTYAGTKEVLRAYHRLLAVVVGEEHPITRAFGPFVLRFENKEPVHSQYFGYLRRCAGLLKFVQTTVHHAIDAHFRNQDPAPLDFMFIFVKINFDNRNPQPVPHVPVPAVPASGGASLQAAPAAKTPSKGVRIPADPAYLDRVAVPPIPHFDPTKYIKKHNQHPYNNDSIWMRLSYHVTAYCYTSRKSGVLASPLLQKTRLPRT
jgi:hypothetical protein